MAIESVASLLRALSDPCRLRLLALCAERPASVSMLAAAVSETEPTVSRHLKALARSNNFHPFLKGAASPLSFPFCRSGTTPSSPRDARHFSPRGEEDLHYR